jgi:hypothetical protein
MNDEFEEPELAGYEPHGEKPLRDPRLMMLMRVFVVVGLLALVLPGILVAVGTANRTAERACAVYVSVLAPGSIAATTRFELFSPVGVGWNCYAIAFDGEELLVRALGLIPGGARVPTAPVENS